MYLGWSQKSSGNSKDPLYPTVTEDKNKDKKQSLQSCCRPSFLKQKFNLLQKSMTYDDSLKVGQIFSCHL